MHQSEKGPFHARNFELNRLFATVCVYKANPVQPFNLGLDIFDFLSLSKSFLSLVLSFFVLFLLCSIAFEVICSSVVSRPSSNQDIIQLNGKSQTL